MKRRATFCKHDGKTDAYWDFEEGEKICKKERRGEN